MDQDMRQLHGELPDDLKVRGWELVRHESTRHRLLEAEWYDVVFRRPFDPGIDDESLPLMVRDNCRSWVRVRTNAARSASWNAAHHDAIGLMRAIDDRRVVQSVVYSGLQE
jgi:hypothetical protein